MSHSTQGQKTVKKNEDSKPDITDTVVHVARHAGPGVVTATNALHAAYAAGERQERGHGSDMVRRVMGIMLRAFPPDDKGRGDYGAAGTIAPLVLVLAKHPNADDDRLVAALQSFLSSRNLNVESGHARSGTGGAVVAVQIAKRYNEGVGPMGPLPSGSKITGLPSDYSKFQRAIGGTGENTDIHPWQKQGSGYKVTLTQGPIGDLDIPEYQRNPEDRERFLRDQGPWLKALEGVLDVVKRSDGSLMILDGGGRVYKKRVELKDPEYVMSYNLHENVGSYVSESALFEKLNGTRRSVKSIEIFVGHLAVGAKTETLIDKVLREFRIADYQHEEEETSAE